MNSASYVRLEDAGLIQAVMMLWDEKKNTAEMATILRLPESEVTAALQLGLEQRRRRDD